MDCGPDLFGWCVDGRGAVEGEDTRTGGLCGCCETVLHSCKHLYCASCDESNDDLHFVMNHAVEECNQLDRFLSAVIILSLRP